MININWRMFFVHRVIFGFWMLKHGTGVVPDKMPWNIWPPTEYEYEIRWDWNWKNLNYRRVPWHRCWDWREREGAKPMELI